MFCIFAGNVLPVLLIYIDYMRLFLEMFAEKIFF